MTISYDVEVNEVGAGTVTYNDIIPSNLSVSGLTPDTDYRFRVRQVNDDPFEESAYSGWVTFTTAIADIELVFSPVISSSIVGALVFDPDGVNPVIALIGDATETIAIGGVYTELGATATDNVDGDISGSITTSGSVDTNSAGIYVITYSVTDAAGNTGSAIRTITINANEVITSYTLAYREIGQAYTEITGIVSSNYPLTGLTPDTDYEFRVKGIGDTAESPWSNLVPFTTTLLPPSYINLPPVVSAGSITGNLTLTKSAIGEELATAYDVEVENTDTSVITLYEDIVPSELHITGLDPVNAHRVRVRGKTAQAVSDWTDYVLFNTLIDTGLANIVTSPSQDLDVFAILDTNVVISQAGVVTVDGTVSETATVVVSLNTTPLPVTRDGLAWSADDSATETSPTLTLAVGGVDEFSTGKVLYGGTDPQLQNSGILL